MQQTGFLRNHQKKSGFSKAAAERIHFLYLSPITAQVKKKPFPDSWPFLCFAASSASAFNFFTNHCQLVSRGAFSLRLPPDRIFDCF
jgi:hypothetical protein